MHAYFFRKAAIERCVTWKSVVDGCMVLIMYVERMHGIKVLMLLNLFFFNFMLLSYNAQNFVLDYFTIFIWWLFARYAWWCDGLMLSMCYLHRHSFFCRTKIGMHWVRPFTLIYNFSSLIKPDLLRLKTW